VDPLFCVRRWRIPIFWKTGGYLGLTELGGSIRRDGLAIVLVVLALGLHTGPGMRYTRDQLSYFVSQASGPGKTNGLREWSS
jgi:hypothetical protein